MNTAKILKKRGLNPNIAFKDLQSKCLNTFSKKMLFSVNRYYTIYKGVIDYAKQAAEESNAYFDGDVHDFSYSKLNKTLSIKNAELLLAHNNSYNSINGVSADLLPALADLRAYDECLQQALDIVGIDWSLDDDDLRQQLAEWRENIGDVSAAEREEYAQEDVVEVTFWADYGDKFFVEYAKAHFFKNYKTVEDIARFLKDNEDFFVI